MEHQTTVTVRYAETDQMGVAHHRNYATWLEIARVDFLRTLGYDYRQVEQDGYYLMLTRLEVRYRKAARFDDQITVQVRVAQIKSRMMAFDYTLTNQHGETVATAVTEHVATDQQYRLVTIPEKLRRLVP